MAKRKKDTNYITLKESRRIIKYNIKQMKYYEGLKRRKLDKSQYTVAMRDPENIIEIDGLKPAFSPIRAR